MIELEEMLEKTLKSGETLTLAKGKNKKYTLIDCYDVDRWDKNGENRWNKSFSEYEKAKAEYDRWN